MDDIHGVIMAGGLGARLRPLTYKVPKPLIEINGKTLIAGVLDRMVSASVPVITIVVNYKGDMIEEYVGKEWGDIPIEYIREHSPRGTAGSLSELKTKAAHVLVSNADLITDIDFKRMVAFHKGGEWGLTVAIREVNHAIPYGVVDIIDDRVYSILEKPTTIYDVNAGMYVINSSCLPLVAGDRPYDMTSFINEINRVSGKVGAYKVEGLWRDIGRHEDLREVEDDFKER